MYSNVTYNKLNRFVSASNSWSGTVYSKYEGRPWPNRYS